MSNTATVTATPDTDPDSSNNDSTYDGTVDRIADLAISKSVDRTADAQAGTQLTFNMIVTNNGPSQATSVEAVDTLPAGVSFVSGTGPSGEDLTESGGQVIVNGGTVDPGGDFGFTIIVTVDSGAGGTLDNRVTVNSNVTDPDTGNNMATASTTVDPVTSEIVGIVFSDLNANGVLDAGENGIADVMMTLVGMDALGNSVRRGVTTNSNGEYTFANLAAGTYDVIQTQPRGYRNGQLEPGSGAMATVGDNEFIDLALAAETSATGWNFGELKERLSKRRFLASS